jgi:excisionase family DNA binding protein
MLSVTESAKILGISPARVRALIAKEILPAEKAGNAWLLREEDVVQRLSQHAHAGRPRCRHEYGTQCSNAQQTSGVDCQSNRNVAAHELYRACKEVFSIRPDVELITQTKSSEEAAFYVAVADFFLQQRQRQIVKQGIY